ncbi:MAG: aldehyde dehydrogenase family protein [Verrucomicrobiota bacterium]
MNLDRDQSTARTSTPNEVAGEVSGVVASVFAAARSAQLVWSRTPITQRLQQIRKLRALIAEHSTELAESAAAARRRPISESLVAEVVPLAEACCFLEKRAAKILAPHRFGAGGRPLWLSGVKSEIRRESWGVVLVIGPGNYPLLLPGVQIVQALVAGNAVVLKPGLGGSPAARVLRRLIELAGIDAHLLGLLPESAEAARVAISSRPNKVLFTGSAAVGEQVLFQLAPQLTPATMELGGCDAVIIRADADLDLVVKALKFGLTINDGATCMAPKRIFVAAARATELEGRLADALRATTAVRRLGGTLQSAVEDLLVGGAHFIAGGLVGEESIRLPAVMGGVAANAKFLREDVFAPVTVMITVADDHEAASRTNDCPYGLGASIFSRDETAAQELAARLNVGVVTINDLLLPTADARLPFGGRGRSGFGSTRGAEGLLELTVPKVVTTTRTRFRFAFEPPHPADAELFQSYLNASHRIGLGARVKAALGVLKNLIGRSKSKSPRN